MNRRTFIKTFGVATAASATAATAGSSAAVGTAVQPDEDDEQPVDNDAGPYTTNQQLTRDLAQLDAFSDRIRLRRLALSAGGKYPIWEVKIGEGDTNVHVITQIHGDEPVGTDAMVLLLQQLAHGQSPRIQKILDNVTLTAVPMVNPDGAMWSQDRNDDGHEERITRRENIQEWLPHHSRYPPNYYSDPDDEPPGYDMNRDFNIRPDFIATPGVDDREEWWSLDEDGETETFAMEYKGETLVNSGLLLTPEVNAVTRSFLEADPDYAITHHHMGIPNVPEETIDGEPQPSLLAILAPFNNNFEEHAPYYDPADENTIYTSMFHSDDASLRSMRLNLLVEEALRENTGPWDFVFDSVTRYGYATYPTLWGSYIDALPPHTDAAAMLYESAGQSSEYGGRAYGLKLETARVGFEVTLDALAEDPELSQYEGRELEYFDIPIMSSRLD